MATTETISVQRPQQQDFERLMQAGTGLVFSAALQPIARLKIADLLADGPHPVSQLAAETGSDEDALYRVMRLLASVGIFAELPGKVFAITPVSYFLRSGVSGSMRDMIIWITNPFHFQVFSDLSHSLATGQPAVEKACGQTAFDAIFSRPEVAYDFNTAMTCFSRHLAPALLEAYDFSGIDTLMDVAGGHGAILCEVLSRYPSLKGILFDIPNVIEEANCHICELKMEERCRTIHGDFFESIPSGADAYYMQHILHDWNDERCLKILANCRRALEGSEAGRKQGRLLIVDNVVPETPGPHPSKWLDIEMLLMPGGRERTRGEWESLFNKAMFEITRIVPMKAAESVIEVRLRA
ncbi:MAG TPA: ArsR family transcriptional regulator [Terriglobales bacterium]|nr:ArsR family transcriptional regulator [Terriglobales bacterium]